VIPNEGPICPEKNRESLILGSAHLKRFTKRFGKIIFIHIIAVS
jgi:hypothetical protein